MSEIEIWGGIECTYNRVGDDYLSQLHKSGHLTRMNDLELIAEIGIKKIRYPCLWEMVAPNSLDELNWNWIDERLSQFKRLGLSPVLGFLHHGSGPQYTNLLDPEFPEKLAKYAALVAQRYPWVEDYTPINEINTTARFSCLYGHWYPHKKDDLSFLRSVFLQCKGTVLAMREIRRIKPSARLVQTDDIGRCQSTDLLKEQCDFENHRRWLAFDILCGKVDENHPLYIYILKAGITLDEIDWAINNPLPPDIIGINHYLLSNRFLDERLELYPEWAHGGNGIYQYADVGAVDTGMAQLPEPASVLMEVWERYKIPLVLTEVHARGFREEQMKWFKHLYNEALLAREKGAEILAVTAWSLLGTYDWNTLCTQNNYFYEPGVFELDSKHLPRKTGLSNFIRRLIADKNAHHPLLDEAGCWATQRRILFGSPEGSFSPITFEHQSPLLITGAGTLGQAFARICGQRNIPYVLLSRKNLDITNPGAVRKTIEDLNPWAVINTAGYVRVDEAEEDQENCFKANIKGPVNLAKVCHELGIQFTTFSSDLVFDGQKNGPYVESHPVCPINIYGESKAICEEMLTTISEDFLIIRTSAFFGPWDRSNFVFGALNAARRNKKYKCMNDVQVSTTYVPDLVNYTLNLIVDGEKGIFHLSNNDRDTWYGFVSRALAMAPEHLNLNQNLAVKKSLKDFKLPAKRPKNSSLKSERNIDLPSFEDALIRYYQDLDYNLL